MSNGLPKRIYWRLLRALGCSQSSWDKQFEAGVWDRGPRSPHTVERVVKLCHGGRLVEFGCGEGTLAPLLPPSCYSEYFGFDISKVAVDRAAEKALAAGMTNCHYEQGDMAKWTGIPGTALILAEECLYYLSPVEVEKFLRRCCECLVPDGHILVIVHSATKHKRTLDVCREVCRVVEEAQVETRAYLTLVP